MFDGAITWAMHNPLQTVALLSAFAIMIGLLLAPGIKEVAGRGHHPRC